jgi:tellurite resistance protein TerC
VTADAVGPAMIVRWWVWALFAFLVLAMLALDLAAGRESRGSPRVLSVRSATAWSAAWISLGLLFGLLVLALYGTGPALTYVTAYVLEKSLSVDNIFVFVLIFSELRIPPADQRRVLHWGILGALVMRGVLIALGVFLLDRFHWVIYPFGALILLAAVRILFGRETERKAVTAACAVCGTWVARVIPITPVLHGGRFLSRQGGRLLATPLLIALIIVETTDLIFALDSIPAVFAVTREPFLIYTSNVFAMLGLRSLYFLLAGAVGRFRHLRIGLAAILAFVGGKMLLNGIVEIPTWMSLAVVATALALAVASSVVLPDERARSPHTGEPAGVPPSRR